MASSRLRLPSLVILASVTTVAAAAQDVATYRNDRHGFSLSYPAATFTPQPQEPPAGDDGRVFVSSDGAARLLAGALPNADGMTLRDLTTRLGDTRVARLTWTLSDEGLLEIKRGVARLPKS